MSVDYKIVPRNHKKTCSCENTCLFSRDGVINAQLLISILKGRTAGFVK